MDTKSVATALRSIADGFTALAEAIELPDVASPASGKSKASTSSAKDDRKSPPVDDSPVSESAGGEPNAFEDSEPTGGPELEEPEPEEVAHKPATLEDLQELGKNLIKAGKRAEFKAVLDGRGLKNLSSSDEKDYEAIAIELNKALKGIE